MSGFPYWKLGGVRDFVGKMSLNRAVPCEVQRTMQFVDDIANNQGKVEEHIFKFWNFVYQALSESLRVFFDCRGVSIFQRQKNTLHLCDVLVGPIDFEMGIAKPCSHSGDFTIRSFG